MSAEFSENSPELPARPELEKRIAELIMQLESYRQKDKVVDILPLAKDAAVKAVEFRECTDFAEFSLYLQKHSKNIAMFAAPFGSLSGEGEGYYNPAIDENGENLPAIYGLIFARAEKDTENHIESMKDILLSEYGIDEKANRENLRFAGVLID